MRQPIHAGGALQPVSSTRAITVAWLSREPRPPAPLLRSCHWAAVVAATLVAAWLRPGMAAESTFVGADAVWSEEANWNAGIPGASDVAVFSQADAATVANLSANTTVGGLRFKNTSTSLIESDGAGRYVLSIGSSGLTVDAGAGNVQIGNNASKNQRVGISLTANQIWTNNSTSLVFKDQGAMGSGTPVTNFNANTVSFAGPGNFRFRGNMQGTGGINTLGPGTVILSTDAIYTGSTTITGGTLQLGEEGTTGSVAGSIVNNSNLVISRSGSVTASSISGTGNVIISGAAESSVSYVAENSYTYTGTTTVSQGALAVASTASLPGWNVAGRYSVAAGAGLALGNAFTDGDVTTVLGAGNLAAGAAIGFDTTAANRTFAGDLAVTFADRPVIKTGANSLILTGANAPQNGTTVYAGTLQVGAGGTTGSLAGDINVLSTGRLAFSRSDDITATNVISGAGTIVQSGTGRLTLSTANPSFSGSLQAPAGTVRVTNGDALGTGTISPGGDTNSGTVEFESGISLPSPLTISARNSTTSTNLVSLRNVSGTNSIGGDVTITAGGDVYQLASDSGLLRLTGTWGAVGSAANTSRAIALTGAGDFDIAGNIPVQGTTAFAFTKSGTGTVFFSGTRDMLGDTTISAGRMTMNPGSLFSNRAGIVTIASGATLAGSGTLANLVRINGIHSPGASPGLQTFTNDLIYEAPGSLVWELSGNTDSSADRGTVYDGVNVTGSGGQLAINTAATLALVFDAPLANADPSTVNFTNAFWDSDRTWQMISLADGATGDNNVFGTISVGADASGNVLSTVRPTASFSVTSQPDGVYLLYAAVPEPAIALMWIGGGAVLGLVARSRRRPA
jgi:fibronectin-binding autotransporter adhesin